MKNCKTLHMAIIIIVLLLILMNLLKLAKVILISMWPYSERFEVSKLLNFPN